MAYAVVTREAAECLAYVEGFARLGLEVVPTPVTTTVEPEDPSALRRALLAQKHVFAIVTSKRGARALVKAYRACIEAGMVRGVTPYAMNESTLEILREGRIGEGRVGGVVPLGRDARDGSELAHQVVAICARSGVKRRFLYPRAADARREPVEILRAAGHTVDDVIAYRTVPHAPADPRGLELLRAGSAAVTAVFAPSQVAALATLVAPVRLPDLATRWLAIGETTAAALREAGIADVTAAAEPTPAGIANAAAAVYRSGQPS